MRRLVEHTFYTDQYLMGKPPAIPQDSFEFYAMQATQYVQSNTFVYFDESFVADYTLKCCICELAEQQYRLEQLQAPDRIISESVDGYHVGYATSTSKPVEQHTTLRGILVKWLAQTGLLYRGGRICT